MKSKLYEFLEGRSFRLPYVKFDLPNSTNLIIFFTAYLRDCTQNGPQIQLWLILTKQTELPFSNSF